MARRIRIPIFTKLIGLIVCLLVVSLVTVVAVASALYLRDSTALIRALGAETAAHLAGDLQQSFAALMERMRLLGEIGLEDEKAFPTKLVVLKHYFDEDKDSLAFFVHSGGEGSAPETRVALTSAELEAAGDRDGSLTWSALSALPGFGLKSVADGAVEVVPFEAVGGTPAVALSVPLVASAPDANHPNGPKRFTHVGTLILRESRLTSVFSDGGVLGSFLVDKEGKLIAPSRVGDTRAGDRIDHKDIVRSLMAGRLTNEERRYLDPTTHEPMLGAFHTVGFGGLGVVTEVPEAKAFASVNRVRLDSCLLGIAVLALACLGAYFFSNSITWPIKQLVLISRRISDGDFEIDLKPRSNDEVADLSVAFNGMARGLKERDFVKETFHKFHNREVAEKLLSGEVKLGGEERDVTVFFSDIRSFTSLSESLAPEEVVEMLNEYMTRMVAVIRKYGGVVDKYVGDAIMAIWGAPLKGASDPYNAVSACLEMRKELARLNEIRLKRNQPVLYVGMGLNSGKAVAGNIGSNEKMEYTVIGDAVNTASRVESMTKELGTDLLVSRSVHEQVKEHFVFDEAHAVQVKGKSRPLEVFKCLGYVDSMGAPVLVQTPYSSYEPGHSDKAVHTRPAA